MRKSVKIICFIAAISFILQGCGNKADNNTSDKTGSQAGSTAVISEKSKSIASSASITSPYTKATESSTTATTAASSASTTESTTSAAKAITAAPSASTTKKKAASAPEYIKGIMIVNKTYSLPSGYNPGVNSEAQSAFNTMAAAASKENISLFIVSGFRSYSTQESIYNNYVAKDGKAAADRYSARPGHSEHQTGLAFDVNSLSQSFENTPEGKWLAANCYKYGFIIRYPKGKENVTGYMYEPWHIRYLGKDTAQKVFDSGKTLEEYLGVSSVYSD